MKTLSWSAGIALLAIAVCVSPADAQFQKCQRTIAKANSQFVQARVKALAKCEEAVVKSGTGSCPDAKASASIQKAKDKLAAAIGKSCGGDDKVCGGNETNEPKPSDLGWPADCPAFEKIHCEAPIEDCGGITTCLQCISEAATDQSLELYYDDLVGGTQANKALNKCQVTIGKATSAFLNAKSKALQKCWDARLNGKHTDDCIEPANGDGKYKAAIDKAEAKKMSTIAKACGGADKAFGGGDDLTPAQIGFPSTCPAVTVPNGGLACGGPVTDLQSLANCVDCVTEFKVDCMDLLAVPQFASFPAECSGVCVEPPASGACPTSFQFTADGPKVDLDAGVSGLGHNATVPTNGRLTLAVSGCSGVAEPTCGTCNISGPLPNAGGVTFDNRRCAASNTANTGGPWVKCETDSDCTNAQVCDGGTNINGLCTTASECPGGNCVNAGYTGPCVYYFGAPLPLVAGGVPTCILNEINGPVSGTVNLEDGTSIANVPLISNVHPVGSVFEPCPVCENGFCNEGPRINQPCTPNGTGIFGDVSLDCPPNPTTLSGSLSINLNIATGTQSVTVSTANPTCRESGYASYRCLCDTCNNINQEACSTDADCPMSGGNPGICGGRRCIGGPNDGEPCANNSECPSGLCNRPGEATKPNACLDDTTTPGQLDCIDIGNNEGQCASGPIEKVCSIQTQVSCGNNDDCQPGSANCLDCLPDQTCEARTRACFTDNGAVGNSVSVSGEADVPCGGIARPTVGTFFCVAPVAQGAVNAASGLPGLGRVRIPGTVVITP